MDRIQRRVEVVELPLNLGIERVTVELAHTPRDGVLRTGSMKAQVRGERKGIQPWIPGSSPCRTTSP